MHGISTLISVLADISKKFLHIGISPINKTGPVLITDACFQLVAVCFWRGKGQELSCGIYLVM